MNKCELCDIIFKSKGLMKQHMLNEHRERIAQLNCNMCSFQASDRNEFMKHVSLHGISGPIVDVQMSQWKCRTCKEVFEKKTNLMKHRCDNHEMPPCRDDLEDNCSRSAVICNYKHKSNTPFRNPKSNEVICYSCQHEFNSLGSMMEHMKTNHPEVVKPCLKALTGEIEKERFWYMHTDINNPDFQLGRNSQRNP